MVWYGRRCTRERDIDRNRERRREGGREGVSGRLDFSAILSNLTGIYYWITIQYSYYIKLVFIVIGLASIMNDN